MPKERIQLIPDSEMQKKALDYKIQTNAINNAAFLALPAEDRAAITEALFNLYADKVIVPRSLSGLEFLTVYVAKFIVKHLQGQELSTEEQAVLTSLAGIVNSHEINIADVNAYQLDYIQTQMISTETNRDEYNANKTNIIGSV